MINKGRIEHDFEEEKVPEENGEKNFSFGIDLLKDEDNVGKEIKHEKPKKRRRVYRGPWVYRKSCDEFNNEIKEIREIIEKGDKEEIQYLMRNYYQGYFMEKTNNLLRYTLKKFRTPQEVDNFIFCLQYNN